MSRPRPKRKVVENDAPRFYRLQCVLHTVNGKFAGNE